MGETVPEVTPAWKCSGRQSHMFSRASSASSAGSLLVCMECCYPLSGVVSMVAHIYTSGCTSSGAEQLASMVMKRLQPRFPENSPLPEAQKAQSSTVLPVVRRGRSLVLPLAFEFLVSVSGATDNEIVTGVGHCDLGRLLRCASAARSLLVNGIQTRRYWPRI